MELQSRTQQQSYLNLLLVTCHWSLVTNSYLTMLDINQKSDKIGICLLTEGTIWLRIMKEKNGHTFVLSPTPSPLAPFPNFIKNPLHIFRTLGQPLLGEK